MRKTELFRITGVIATQYSQAVSDIESVSTAADNAAENIGSLGDEAENTQESVEGLGEETENTGENVEDTNDGFTVWKSTLSDLASDVIKKVISKVTDLAKEIVGLGEDFTATMSEVKAISGASDEEFEKLKETAREFGSKTVFSATEAAEALKYMALAGWDTEQSTSALGGVLDLAAASGMGLGEASDMVTDYLSAFGMEAKDSAYFADMLAYAQSNSNTTAAQLGDAYGNCAASLHAAGQDVETVTSFLEAMANQGLKGSEAGTALSATMRDITNAMSTVKDKTDLAQLAQSEFVSSTGDLNDLLGKNYIQMGKTLVPVSDANGNFRDLTDIITDVSKATDGMGDAQKAAAMSSTFTSYSIKGVNLVLNEGIDKVAGYEEALRGADDSALDMAATMNDNLKGDLAGMNSALEELKLKIYDGLEEPLRSAVQFVTGKVVPALTALLQNFDKIAPPIGIAATAIATFLIVANASTILTALTTGIQAITGAFGALNAVILANPIALVIAAIAALVAAFVYLWNNCDKFREFWINLWNKIKTVTQPIIEKIKDFFVNLWENVKPILQQLKDSFEEVWDSLKELFSSIWKVISPIIDNIKELFVLIWESAQPIIEKVIESFQNLWETVQPIIEKIKDIIGDTIENIKDWFKSLIDNISPTIDKIKDIILTVISEIEDMLSAAWEAIKAIWDFAKPYFEEIWNNIKAIFEPVAEVIGKSFSVAWDNIKLVWDISVQYFKTVWDNIKIIFSAVGHTLGAFFGAAWDNIKIVWDLVVGYFKTIWENIKLTFNVVEKVFKGDFKGAWESIKKIWDNVGEYFLKVWEGIEQIFSNVIGFFKTSFSEAWKAIKGVFSNVGDFFSEIWNTIKGRFSSIGTKIGEAIGSAFKLAINSVIATVENGINFIPNSINKALDLINKLPNVEISAIPTVELPRLAQGGIVDKSTVVEAGEDGPEAIVPLKNNTEWTGRVANLINAQIPSKNDSAILERLDEIISLMKNNIGEPGGINFTFRIDNFNNNTDTSTDDLKNKIAEVLYELIKRDKLARE